MFSSSLVKVIFIVAFETVLFFINKDVKYFVVGQWLRLSW